MTDLRRAQELCVFCPKMCRFSCPVSEATSREAFTPWGKVSLAALSGRSPDASAALAFGACTGCLYRSANQQAGKVAGERAPDRAEQEEAKPDQNRYLPAESVRQRSNNQLS